MIKEIDSCRVCKNTDLDLILDLGEQKLTGVFPSKKELSLLSGPLKLVKCRSSLNSCGLVQLKHTFPLSEMYGDNYGYRSGLNNSMVNHLKDLADKIKNLVSLKINDLVLDIGSNDCTLLRAYDISELVYVGIDPSGLKFLEYYPKNVTLIPSFFSAKSFQQKFGTKKAKVITSIAMFYDLEDPVAFMSDIYNIIDEDGVWLLEQSYLPQMLSTNSFDTACHEHLEYYAIKQMIWMAEKVGFKILDIDFNEINGGSFNLILTKKNSPYAPKLDKINQAILKENNLDLDNLQVYKDFYNKINQVKKDILDFLTKMRSEKKLVLGYGASTKGNVLLQFCEINPSLLPAIAEVNEDKFGRFTPGTGIPIISESEAKKMNPDYFLVLPWHFKNAILQKERIYLQDGGKLIFPLPFFEIISK
jgi:hypothetical protein